jgi:hypothetical protein
MARQRMVDDAATLESYNNGALTPGSGGLQVSNANRANCLRHELHEFSQILWI